MTENILIGFEAIQNIMKGCIEAEMTPDGLLRDVETFVPVFLDEANIEEPCVWMFQHATIPTRDADISHTMDLQTPFEFDCAVYESDIEDAVTSSQNLCNRVILSILKNFLSVQSTVLNGRRVIRNITLDTYSPVGELTITGKSDKVPVTGVVLNVTHTVNWTMCCRNLENQNQNQNNQGE